MNILEHFIITKKMVKDKINDLYLDLNLALDFEDNILANEIAESISELTKLYFTLNNKK